MITSTYVAGTQYMFWDIEEYSVSERDIKNKFLQFEDLLIRINDMAYRMQTLEVAVPRLMTNAQELADAAKASITPERLTEIREKAGSSDAYFATLYNQLYLEELAKQYERELGSDIMSAVRSQISVNNEFIEAAKPTVVTSVLESEVVDQAIKVGEQIQREGIVAALTPEFVKKAGMAGTILMGGALAGGILLVAKLFKRRSA